MHKLWKEWRVFIFFALALGLFRGAVADWYLVPTGSMKPTILEGDYVLTDKLAYRLTLPFSHATLAHFDHPRRGDIVVFDSPLDGTRLVKRVIGLPGESVAMLNNRLYINGQPLQYVMHEEAQVQARDIWPESSPLLLEEGLAERPHPIAIRPDAYRGYQSFTAIEVPAGHYFMLGDNRDNSGDSRVFGTVDEDLIYGRAKRVLFSLDWNGSYLPRDGRALKALN